MRAATSTTLALTLAALASAARADFVSHSANVGPIAVGGTASVTLPQFDARLGVLRVARVTIAARVSGTLGFENTAGHPQNVGGGFDDAFLGAIVPVQPSFGGVHYACNPVFNPPVSSLSAYDGATDYAGTSGVTLPFTDQTGGWVPSQTGVVWTDAELQLYVGAGTFDVTLGAVIQFGPYLPPGIVSAQTVFVDATVTVVYTFDVLPAQICRATTGSTCPCGNDSKGLAGCGNSAHQFGGALAASGTSSLSNDTLVLSGSGMTNSSALYFQGTSFRYQQIVYGDGLRCVTGTLVRLGTKTNVSGASSYPGAGDLPVSVRGQVPGPGVRYYQVVYRDLGNYCTPATFNATSGMAIRWSL